MAQALPEGPPIPGGRKKAEHAAWLALAALDDPSNTRGLLASLASGTSPQARERLEALGNDPAVLVWLLAAFDAPCFTAETTRPFWRSALAKLEACADGETAAAAEALGPTMVSRIPTAVGEWLSNQLAKLATRLRKRTFPTPLPGLAALESTLGSALIRPEVPVESTGATLEELIEAVWAAPDDDAPRLVLQDVLLEQGDPLGELIALDRTGADPERLAVLTRELQTRMLGPLAAAVQLPRFRLGFPEHVDLWRNKASVPKVVGLPCWSTVRSLRVGSWPLETYEPDRRLARALRELVGHEVMRSLRVIDGIRLDPLEALLAERVRPWTTVAIRVHWGESPRVGALLAGLPALEDLTVHLTGDDESALASLVEAGPTLRRLAVSSRLDPEAWLPLATAAGVERFDHGTVFGKRVRTAFVRVDGALRPADPGRS